MFTQQKADSPHFLWNGTRCIRIYSSDDANSIMQEPDKAETTFLNAVATSPRKRTFKFRHTDYKVVARGEFLQF